MNRIFAFELTLAAAILNASRWCISAFSCLILASSAFMKLLYAVGCLGGPSVTFKNESKTSQMSEGKMRQMKQVVVPRTTLLALLLLHVWGQSAALCHLLHGSEVGRGLRLHDHEGFAVVTLDRAWTRWHVELQQCATACAARLAHLKHKAQRPHRSRRPTWAVWAIGAGCI